MAVDAKGSSTYAAAYQAQDKGKDKLQELKHFKVKIFSPYQTYYEGDATSLSAVNRTGPFDILPGHISFFSLLTGGQVILNTGFQLLEFQIARGILRVSGDQVTLFADV
jgi:F0F1-type ATP synthase epsilon subunit